MTESEKNESLVPEITSPVGAETQSKKKRSVIKSILIVVLLTPFYLLLFEGIARLSPYQPRSSPLLVEFINPEWKDTRIFNLDPELFWRFRPNQELFCRSSDLEEYKIPINNIGFRGDPFPDPKSKDCFRVMFLGDSCVFGWDVPVGRSFPERLQARLEEAYPNRNFHAFIGGAPGYTSFQAKLVLDLYGAEYDPDLVIVYLGSNDAVPCIGDPDRIMMERARKAFYRQQLLEKSRLYCLGRDLADLIGGDKSKSSPKPDWEKGPFRVSLDEYEQNLSAIVDQVRNQLHAVPMFLTRQDLQKGKTVFRYNDVMRKVAEKTDVPLVDVRTFFANHPDPQSLYSKPKTDTVHPNSKGYDAVAQLVFETIQSNGLIDSPHSSP